MSKARKGIIFLSVVIGSFFILAIPVVWAKVLIGAVAPQITSTTDEYVELYNYSSTSVSLSNWSLKKNASTGSSSTLVSDFGAMSIAPFGYFLVAHQDYAPIEGVVVDKVYTANSNNLSVSNNGVVLFDDVGLLVDSVFWGNVVSDFLIPTTSNPAIGKSVVRRPNDDTGNYVDTDNCAADFVEIDPAPRNSASLARPVWVPLEETPFTPSTTPTTTPTTTPDLGADTSSLWAAMRLNEIVSDSTEGDEWVEFFNPSSSSLDLVGGLLCDERGADASSTACKDLTGIINPMDYLVFYWGGYFLNNDADSVIFKSPSGTIVDRVDYGGALDAPVKGQSLARDPADDTWKITTQITSGTANIILSPVVQQNNLGGGGGDPLIIVPKTTTTTKSTTTIKEVVAKKDNSVVWNIIQPKRIVVGTSTMFSAIGTLDARGGKFVYLWDFGEGQSVGGSPVLFTFASSGAHIVTVRATSTAGSVGTKQFKIMVWPTSTVASAVVIGAVLPNEKGVDDAEYIKLQNTGTSSVDISRWKILYKEDIYQIPASTTIVGGDDLVFYKAITKFSLNNSGGVVELRDAQDFLIDVLEYSKTVEGKEMVGSVISNPNSTVVIASNTVKITSAKKTTTAKSAGTYLGMVSVAQAREAVDGSGVRVQGTVTALPGIFGSQYFYIADGESGIQIYQNKKDFPGLEVGDNVSVLGTLGTAYGERRLRVRSHTDIDILSTHNTASSTPTEITEIDEVNLGALVKIRGEITEIKSSFMYVDDGASEAVVYFKKGAQVDKKKFQEGENVEVVGVLARGSSGLQVWPRAQADIVSLGPSDDLLKKQGMATSTANNSKTVAETYLTTTAGGITALLLAFFARARGALLIGGAKKIAQVAGKFFGRG